jgi:lipoyl-dependent peroxiredoxin
MPTRTASAVWNGSLTEGSGTMRMGSGAYEGPYSFQSRFEEGDGTNPEELIAAAHAGCFSMALSAELGKAGITPDSVETEATVHLAEVEGGFAIK